MSNFSIKLNDGVSCYQLKDGGKIFINKSLQKYADFTDLNVILSTDVQTIAPQSLFIGYFSLNLLSISDNSFADTLINKAYFPSSLLSIGDYAFLNAEHFKASLCSSKLKYIGDHAFESTDAENASFDLIEHIGASAFALSSLKNIAFDLSMSYPNGNRLHNIIANDAFSGADASAYFMHDVKENLIHYNPSYPFGLNSNNIFAYDISDVSSIYLNDSHITNENFSKKIYDAPSYVKNILVGSNCSLIDNDAFKTALNINEFDEYSTFKPDVKVEFLDKDIFQVQLLGNIPFGLSGASTDEYIWQLTSYFDNVFDSPINLVEANCFIENQGAEKIHGLITDRGLLNSDDVFLFIYDDFSNWLELTKYNTTNAKVNSSAYGSWQLNLINDNLWEFVDPYATKVALSYDGTYITCRYYNWQQDFLDWNIVAEGTSDEVQQIYGNAIDIAMNGDFGQDIWSVELNVVYYATNGGSITPVDFYTATANFGTICKVPKPGSIPVVYEMFDAIIPLKMATLQLTAQQINAEGIDNMFAHQSYKKYVSSVTVESSCLSIMNNVFEGFTNPSFNKITVPQTVEYVGKAAFAVNSTGIMNLTAYFEGRTWQQMKSLAGYPFGLPTFRLSADTPMPVPVKTPLVLSNGSVTCRVGDGKIFHNPSAVEVLDMTNSFNVSKNDVDAALYEKGINRSTLLKVVTCLSSSTGRILDEAFSGLSNLNIVEFVDDVNNVYDIGDDAFKDCNLKSSLTFNAWKMIDIANCSSYPFGLADDTIISSYDMNDIAVVDYDVDSFDANLISCETALIRKSCKHVNGGYDASTDIATGFTRNEELRKVICKYDCSFGNNAFLDCTLLRIVDSPNVNSIGASAFDNCYTLASIDLQSVSSIGDSAFNNCRSLQKIDVSNCEHIGNLAFFNTVSLISIELPETIDTVNDYAFQIHDSLSQYAKLSCVIMPNVTLIKQCAFLNLKNLIYLDAPAVTTIGGNSFMNTSISSFDFENIEQVGDYAFSGTKLVTVDLKNALFDGVGMFSNCSDLSSVSMLNATHIQDGMFGNCYNLKSVSYDKDNIIYHGSGSFDSRSEYARSIVSIDLPNLLSFESGAFNVYPNLKHVNIGSVSTIKQNAFEGIDLNTLNISSAASIGQYAFKNASVKYVNANDLTVINQLAFAECSCLNVLDAPNVTYIWPNAFNHSNIESAYIGLFVTYLDEYAFYDCRNLLSIIVSENNSNYTNTLDGVTYTNAVFTRNGELHIACSSLDGFPNGLVSFSAKQLTAFRDTTSITIPSTLTGDIYHLEGMSSLQHIIVEEGNPVYTDLSGCDCVVKKSNGLLVAGCCNTKLTAGISSISEMAFYFRDLNLLDISLSGASDLTAIDNNAFMFCTISCMSISKLTNINYYDKFKRNVQIETLDCTLTSIPLYFMYGTNIKFVNISNAEIINSGAFSECQNIISVDASNAKKINYNAFSGCTKLENIQLGNVEEINSSIFLNCYKLISADLHAVKTDNMYNNSLFENCYSLQNVMLPFEITAFETNMFSGCSNLTSIVNESTGCMISMPDIDSNTVLGDEEHSCKIICESGNSYAAVCTSVTRIGYGAFKNCTKLNINDNISFENVESIGDEAFYNCKELYEVDAPKIVDNLYDSAFYGSGIETVNMPQLQYIQANAFKGCINLTSVNAPMVTSIYQCAFDGCFKLSAFNGMQYAQNIEQSAFVNCGISAADMLCCTSIADSVFLNCSNLVSVNAPEVTSLNNYVFAGCTKLSSVNMPMLSYMSGEFIFNGCSSLTSLSFDNLNVIGSKSLWYAGIHEMTIPYCTWTINYDAFNEAELIEVGEGSYSIRNYETRCRQLTSVYFKDRSYYDIVYNIGKYESGMGMYEFYDKNKPFGINKQYIKLDYKYTSKLVLSSGVFKYAVDGGIMYIDSIDRFLTKVYLENNDVSTIPYGKNNLDNSTLIELGLKSNDTTWNVQPVSIDFGMNISSIGENAFYNCTKIEEITLPKYVKSIGKNAFNKCYMLSNIVFENNEVSIGFGAFSNCNSLSNVELPSLMSSVSDSMFAGCMNLANVNLHDNIVEIRDSAFSRCSNLTSILLPNALKNIGSNAFYGCGNLISINLPDSIENIGYRAFTGCTSLSGTLELPASLSSIKSETFENCSNITDLHIKDNVIEIQYDAFLYCSNLSSITFGRNLTAIGYSAFGECTSLVNLVLPNNLESIEEGAFYGCSNLSSAEFGSNLAYAGGYTFYDCAKLSEVKFNAYSTDIPIETLTENCFIDDPTYGGGEWWNVDSPITIRYIDKSYEIYIENDEWIIVDKSSTSE